MINTGIHKAKSIRIGQWLRDEPTILKIQVLVWRLTQGEMLIEFEIFSIFHINCYLKKIAKSLESGPFICIMEPNNFKIK